MCPCPRFAGRTDVVAATARSMLAVAHFHASRAVHKICFSGGYGPLLPALRASVDADASWVKDSPGQKQSVLQQEAGNFGFPPRVCVCHGLVLVVGFYARTRKLE